MYHKKNAGTAIVVRQEKTWRKKCACVIETMRKGHLYTIYLGIETYFELYIIVESRGIIDIQVNF